MRAVDQWTVKLQTKSRPMNETRAVLWDMDGTLIDSEEFHWISWRDAMADEGIAITRAQFLSSFGQRNDSILPQWLGDAATPERIVGISGAKELRYRRLIREKGSRLCLALQDGYAGCTSKDGSKQSPQRLRVPTSKLFLRRLGLAIGFRRSLRLRMCPRENPIPKCISWRLSGLG